MLALRPSKIKKDVEIVTAICPVSDRYRRAHAKRYSWAGREGCFSSWGGICFPAGFCPTFAVSRRYPIEGKWGAEGVPENFHEERETATALVTD